MTIYFYLFQTPVCLYPNSNLDKGNYSKQKDIQLIKGGQIVPLLVKFVGTDYPQVAFLLSLIRLRHLFLLLNSQARLLDADKPAAVTTDANAPRRRHNPS